MKTLLWPTESKSKLKNDQGLFLMELLVSLCVAAIATLAISGLFSSVIQQESETKAQLDLDTQHSHLVQSMQSLTNIRRTFSLSESSPSAISRCLMGKGSDCLTLATAASDLSNYITRQNASVKPLYPPCMFATENSPQCQIQQQVSYEWICTRPTECSSLRFRIVSSYSGGLEKEFRPRESFVGVPGRALLSRGKLDFNCTTGSMFMGIDFDSLQAICQPISNAPMLVAQLKLESQLNCANGVTGVGIAGSPSDECAQLPPPVETIWPTPPAPQPVVTPTPVYIPPSSPPPSTPTPTPSSTPRATPRPTATPSAPPSATPRVQREETFVDADLICDSSHPSYSYRSNTIPNNIRNQIVSLYLTLNGNFGRCADVPGYKYWIDMGWEKQWHLDWALYSKTIRDSQASYNETVRVVNQACLTAAKRKYPSKEIITCKFVIGSKNKCEVKFYD